MTSSVWLRPERTGVGRPPRWTRDEVTRAAVAVADREGIEAVTMRRVGAELGTGAGSLYRYVQSRDELLDLMADLVAGEYSFADPTGDWLADLVDVGLQAREIHRRHTWLPERVMTSPAVGPRTVELLERYLAVVAGVPADDRIKLTAFGIMNALIALLARNEQVDPVMVRNAEFMAHIVGAGSHPHLSALRAPAAGSVDPLPEILRAVLTGFLDGRSS